MFYVKCVFVFPYRMYLRSYNSGTVGSGVRHLTFDTGVFQDNILEKGVLFRFSMSIYRPLSANCLNTTKCIPVDDDF